MIDVIPIVTRITHNKLYDSNFFEWSKMVRVYLRSIGKASHLTSDPPDDVKEQWLQDDAKLFLQIWNSIESFVTPLINHWGATRSVINCLCYGVQENL